MVNAIALWLSDFANRPKIPRPSNPYAHATVGFLLLILFGGLFAVLVSYYANLADTVTTVGLVDGENCLPLSNDKSVFTFTVTDSATLDKAFTIYRRNGLSECSLVFSPSSVPNVQQFMQRQWTGLLTNFSSLWQLSPARNLSSSFDLVTLPSPISPYGVETTFRFASPSATEEARSGSLDRLNDQLVTPLLRLAVVALREQHSPFSCTSQQYKNTFEVLTLAWSALTLGIGFILGAVTTLTARWGHDEQGSDKSAVELRKSSSGGHV